MVSRFMKGCLGVSVAAVIAGSSALGWLGYKTFEGVKQLESSRTVIHGLVYEQADISVYGNTSRLLAVTAPSNGLYLGCVETADNWDEISVRLGHGGSVFQYAPGDEKFSELELECEKHRGIYDTYAIDRI